MAKSAYIAEIYEIRCSTSYRRFFGSSTVFKSISDNISAAIFSGVAFPLSGNRAVSTAEGYCFASFAGNWKFRRN
jgi:hypothetical protein